MNKLAIPSILQEVKKIISKEDGKETVLLEITQLLKTEVYHYDWVGFYILNKKTDQLELGPYSGKATEHTQIPIGKGVCGQVAVSNATMIVQDVSQMENYISCSIDVQSEIVVPIIKNGKFVAEIDIDSHSPAPFTEDDKFLLEEICKLLDVLFE
jgi:L-methionine (R)-S-oxide reductase